MHDRVDAGTGEYDCLVNLDSADPFTATEVIVLGNEKLRSELLSNRAVTLVDPGLDGP